MERFNQGENVILGYRHPKSFESSENARHNNSEMDFNDVFGGPPKRYSMQEMRMRYSFSETIDSEDDNPVFSTRGDPSWSGLNEKPVFGEESVNRRRYNKTGDFFDDIFKGDESYGSPRKTDRDPVGSAPGSRVLSPARPLPPPEAELFGTSLPAQFSLPAKLTTAIDAPVFGSGNSFPDKNKDGISNELSKSQISKPSFSKFLKRSNSGKKEGKGDRQFYRQSVLSREASLAGEESPQVIKSDGYDKGSEFKEDPVDGSQFHFSIYKWPGGGVPLMTSLWVGKSSRLEETSKNERLSSSNGSIGSNGLDNETSEYDNMDSISRNAEPESSEVEKEQNDTGINEQETEFHIKYANREVLESKLLDDMKNPAAVGTEECLSSDRVGIQEKLGKDVLTNVVEHEMKPLPSENVDAKGISNEENGSAAKKGPISHKEKKNDAKMKTSKKESVKKDSGPGSPMKNTPVKTGVKGKVTEFVKIFNQESRKTKIDVDKRSESSKWKKSDNYGIDNEGSNVNKVNEKMESSKVDYTPKAAFSKVDETPQEDAKKQPETPNKDTMKQPSNIKTSDHTSSRFTDQKDSSSFRASSHGTSKATSENSEDHFHESFLVEEINQDQDKVSQTSGDPEDIRASDAKIQQWSNGRKGNIRSLLSTLQLVLWPESGWKPVPLVNIIEGNSVKRAYQRALLCLHPDKLQQKDASFLQKYIAEKVFDILQEAWDHFNSLGAI